MTIVEVGSKPQLLIEEIKKLIKQRAQMLAKSKKIFEMIRSKTCELHEMCPELSNADIGEHLGQTERWVARVLGAKTPAGAAHSKLLGQLKKSCDSIKGETDASILSALVTQLEVTLHDVTARLAIVKSHKGRKVA